MLLTAYYLRCCHQKNCTNSLNIKILATFAEIISGSNGPNTYYQ